MFVLFRYNVCFVGLSLMLLVLPIPRLNQVFVCLYHVSAIYRL